MFKQKIKQGEIQSRMKMQEEMKRQKTMQWLHKWDDFRDQKNKYLDFMSALMKHRNLIKRWIAWIQTWKIMKTFIVNYEIWHHRNIAKFNRTFLAIKFKIRFRLRFQRKFGFVYKIRQQKVVNRVLTFQTQFLRVHQQQKAQSLIYKTIFKALYINQFKRKMHIFVGQIFNFQKLLKMAIIRKNMKKEFLGIVLERELQELVIAYQKTALFPKMKRDDMQQMVFNLRRIMVSPVYTLRKRQLMTAYLQHQKAINLAKFHLRVWCEAYVELRELEQIRP